MSYNQQVKLFLNLIFVCLFFGHIILIGYGTMYPENQSVRVHKENLKDLDFPVYFKLCARELENDTEKYQRLGYRDYFNFYVGDSMYNRSLVGWNGHSPNGSTLGSVERKEVQQMMSKIFQPFIFQNC